MTTAGYLPETFVFLKALADNNTKDWFEANKADYQRFVKKPSDAFRASLETALGELTGHEIVSKQFRINRDLRFSKDKTPYNTHVRMAFWPKGSRFEGKDAQPPSFFLSIEADHIRAGTGCMAFARPELGDYLHRLENGGGDALASLLKALGSKGFELSAPDLARVPKGFPSAHPHAELARHKGLAVWKTLKDTSLVQGETGAGPLLDLWASTLPFWNWQLELSERT